MITVIIITHNRSFFLKRSLMSLSLQTKKADEVIVVDNNSSDDTKKIVLGFKNKLPIKYVFEKNKSFGNARNTGVKNAKGDIILFIDDDCLAEKYWLETLYKETLKNYDIAGGSRTVLGENIFSWTDYFITAGPLLNPKLKRKERFNLSTSNVAIKKSVFNKIGFFNKQLPLAEDRDFFLRAKNKGLKLIFSPKAKVKDIGFSKNLTTLITRMKRYGFGIMASYLKQKDNEPLSKYFSKNIIILTLLSPIYISLETIYTLLRNIKQSPIIILYTPLLIISFIFWHYGMIKSLAENNQ